MEIRPFTTYFISFSLISKLANQIFEIGMWETVILILIFIVFKNISFPAISSRSQQSPQPPHRESHVSRDKAPKPHADAALPPGPTPWPVVGCVPTMLMNKPVHRWIHSIMKKFNTEIACIRLGNIHVIPVSSPELAIEFLKTHDSVFASRPITISTKMVSKGELLTTAFTPMGDQWKKMRRILASEMLSPSRLRWMHDKRMDEADNLLRYIYTLTSSSSSINSNRNSGVVNLRSITQHYCGNIARKMLFNKRYYGKGREDGGPTCEEDEHVHAVFKILSYIYSFCVSDYMPCLKAFDLDGHQKAVKKALRTIRKNDEPIIHERIKQWKEGNKKQVEDILDIFITLKDENGNSLLSVQEISAQTTEIQLEVVDNPSNAVEWAMAELINQPKILQKAVEELDRVVGKDRLVQEHDIPQLKYLMACARESFRLHPLVPFNVPHESNADVIVGGYFIPKGSQVLLGRSALGRNPRIWKDPMRFDPERHFENGDVTSLGLAEPNLRFITFTRGRRSCVGGSLATSMTIMLFARLLQGFSWSLPNGMAKIEFSESTEFVLEKPLELVAQPRLPHMNMYQKR